MFNDHNAYVQQLTDIIQAGRVMLSDTRPSDWVEQNVVMGLPRPGPYQYSYTPYCREIIDRLYSADPARWIAVMKGLQIGVSAGVIIPGMGYIIKEAPGNTYFTVGAPDLIDKSWEKLDLMIDRADLRQYIKPQIQRVRANKSGDTNRKKDFSGGFINITTPNNHKEWRDVSLKYGFIDDFESAKTASKESGSTRKLIEGRFAAYADSHKIFYISTPELKTDSNIEPAYLLGDQRKYMIPCPCCGEFIELKWAITNGDINGGITWKLDEDGKLIEDSVGYICQKCGDFFDDRDKMEWLNLGHWEPTATPSKPGYFSYHISSLYAPIGMYDWKHYVHDWLEAHPPGQPRKEDLYKTFVNTCLGETYEPLADSPKATQIMKNTRDYEIGTIPEKLSIADGNGKIILITCAADMNGIMKEGNHDVRLDYEVLAHAESGATYSITHGSIGTFIPREGANKVADRVKWTYDQYGTNSVWPEFDKILASKFKTDTGREMGIAMSALDTGHFTAYAYAFVDTTNNPVIAVKGDKEDRYLRHTQDMKLYKQGLERQDLYILQVGIIKDRLSEYMSLHWNGESEQPANFMNFPQPANGLYGFTNFFEHYEAEHRTVVTNKDGANMFRWVKKNSGVQAHLWDCRVYNIAVREVLIGLIGKESKEKSFTWKDYARIVTGG